MKKIVLANLPFVVLFSIALLAQSCKKDDDESTGLSEKVQTVIPQSVVDQVKTIVPINQGKKPPVLDGYYVTAPYEVIAVKNSNHTVGTKLGDYVYKFSGFDASGETVNLSYKRKAYSSIEGIGSGAVVSGFNNKFTLYAKTVNGGNDYYEIFSGEVTPSGIKDWVDAIISINSTSGEVDFYNVLKDSDGMADKSTTESFRRIMEEKLAISSPKRGK